MEGVKTSPRRSGVPEQRHTNISARSLLQQGGHWLYIARLIAFFCVWKILLLVIVCLSPGPGYDSSTSILFSRLNGSEADATPSPSTLSARVVDHVVLRLTRWDALYFASASQCGLVYEQEWAFSWALSRFTALLSNVLPTSLPASPIVRHALTGTLVSHISHLGAVLSLYRLASSLLPSARPHKQAIAFTTASLHILSPAGVFLSAPYAEAPFAFTTFLGLFSHVLSLKHRRYQSLLLPAAGICFAGAAMLRSNGLLNGIPLALDFFATLSSVITCRPSARDDCKTDARSPGVRLLALVVAGLTTLAGFALPQYAAYKTYCTTSDPRPWCGNLPPSIYTFVQKEYWGVGFLQYWTVSNAPLFLLAAPMLSLLIATGLTLLRSPGAVFSDSDSKGTRGRTAEREGERRKGLATASSKERVREEELWELVSTALGAQQVVLAGLALTSFHVQVVNRLSSGLAGWYLVLGCLLQGQYEDLGLEGRDGVVGMLGRVNIEWVVRGMVLYAIVQGALFAGFLPPA